MYEFWYDCIQPKYGEKTKLCFLDTDTFIVYIKSEDIYSNIENIKNIIQIRHKLLTFHTEY